MREFQRETGEKLIRVVCNRCGKEMRVENGCLKEGCFHGEAHFGYFSRKDGSSQQFDLCESCYDAITAEFVIPAQETEETLLI